MGKTAFVFPGQGAQQVGMGSDLYREFGEVRELYSRANEVIGYNLKTLSFEGPETELNKTYHTQPCILTASIAAYKALAGSGIRPDAVAGHSLGEYSSLVCADVIRFEDALLLTEKRGRFMQEAVPEGQGLMAAILGLSRDEVNRLCLEVTSGYVAPANYNTPQQIVIAGEKDAVMDAIKLMKKAGAKRAVPLNVSVPSHCSLMVEASNKLSVALNDIEFRAPEVRFVNNADAMILTNTESIKSSLVRQLNSPLLWEDSINVMVNSGIDTFIEVGPGTTLAGLIKRIDETVRTFNVSDVQSMKKTVESLT